jgi:hypothetical protein
MLKTKLSIFVFFLIGLSIGATAIFSMRGQLVSYGDAESHLNIAKRVVDSITPGLAQLGGIWLPLPHLMLVPFMPVDYLYRSGLAGSIVSGVMFVVSVIAIYKLINLLSKNTVISVLGSLLFAFNSNILYLQSTAMTEIPLLAFFILSVYFFTEYLTDENKILSLVYAAFFGLCASLSRYDGWFLVLVEAGILVLNGLIKRYSFTRIEGIVLLFSSLAFVGILSWFLWDYLILNDPLYFTNSPFSAKSQQQSWLSRGELPGYKDIVSSVYYYAYTSYVNVGKYLSVFALFSFVIILFARQIKVRFYMMLLLLSPFIFNILTLYMGQSIIFIPGLTPDHFEWKLFNVRYGVMMIPAAAVISALFAGQIYNILPRFKSVSYTILTAIITVQLASFVVKAEIPISLADGIYGLSSAKKTDAQDWIKENYDDGLVLMDDYARSVSIVKSDLPMRSVIYVGNKPYWEESLAEPERHAKWIVMQKGDDVWRHLYDNPTQLERVYKYFEKAYTSPNVLVFKRI